MKAVPPTKEELEKLFRRARLPDVSDKFTTLNKGMSFLSGFMGLMNARLDGFHEGVLILGEQTDKLMKKHENVSEQFKVNYHSVAMPL